MAYTLLGLLTASPAGATETVVIDGDTLALKGERIRLEGIDAPELAQTCLNARGAAYPCGRASLEHLKRLAGTDKIRCEGTTSDTYGRRLATCFAGSRNLNQAMVEDGHAFAFERYSVRYVMAQQTARQARRGIWAGSAEPPWDFRKSKWQVAGASAPAGCPIKGNISANGRIYHTPWSPHYARTRINEAAGERWFCSEAEAVAAGWRPPLS